jgi:ComF family protein
VAGLKSHGAVAVAAFMAAEIAARAPPLLLEADAVAPVPAHRRRHRRHGFNQAEAIARSLSRATGLPTLRLLEREGAARPQVGLERRARLANARDSVRLRPRAAVPRRVLLVDDVYTTGATLDACARALRRAGAGRVTGVTFARAVRQ